MSNGKSYGSNKPSASCTCSSSGLKASLWGLKVVRSLGNDQGPSASSHQSSKQPGNIHVRLGGLKKKNEESPTSQKFWKSYNSRTGNKGAFPAKVPSS